MSHWDDCEMCNSKERPGLLHVYAQRGNHDEVHIVGDVKALILLRNTIDQALMSTRNYGKTWVSPSDGETYTLYVVKHESERMDKLALPYHDWDQRRGRYPSSLVPEVEEDEVLGDKEWFEAQRRFGTDYEKGENIT